MQEKNAIENLNFLINLAMVSNDTKQTLEEPQMLNEAWNHPNKDSSKKREMLFVKNLQTQTSNRYGKRHLKVLCSLIAGESKTNGSSKLSAIV